MSDFRFAARMLWKQPSFTILTAVTLALGIGATTAVFSLIHGVLLTPPPYSDPGRIVLLPSVRADGGKTEEDRTWPSAQWQDWQTQAKSFEAIFAYGWTFNFLVEQGGSESLEGMYVTREYFTATGLQPVAGRAFSAQDGTQGAPAVVLLGYEFWQRKFHGDHSIVGKPLRISRSDTPPTVIGVMPPAVRFFPAPSASQEPNYNVNAHVDFWLCAVPNPARRKNLGWNVAGRLRPGVTREQAQAELAGIVQREAQADRDFQGFLPRVEPLAEEENRDGDRMLFPLLGAAGLVLLIACGNVAALLLVRGMQRQGEYAVRTALGVARSALFRQATAESLLLALAGSALGTGLAAGAVAMFRQIGGRAIPRLDSVTLGWPVLACALACAVFAALLAGVLPAWRASSLDPATALKGAGARTSAGRAERRLLRGVTIFQTALTLALLTGAGLLIRTMINLQNVNAGYDTAHIATMTVTAVQGDTTAFHRRALAQIAALPGVKDAAFAWGVPLTGNSWPVDVEVEGQPPVVDAKDRVPLPARSATPGYFGLLGQRIVQGRDIRSTDGRGVPLVAVVNQALVDRFFPAANPLGKKIWMNGRDKPANEIVGVVANTRTADLTHPAVPELYFSFWQAQAFSKDLVVRTAADPRAVLPAIERTLRSVDPTVAVENVRTLEQIRNESQASRAFAMQLLIGFSLVGCALSLVGIYGVLSLSVASRRRELAIRAAIGAGTREITGLVFAEGFRLIAAGILLGIVAALALSRILQAFLYDVRPTDPLTLAAVGLLFAAVALLACWIPGRRAAAVDPIEALRSE